MKLEEYEQIMRTGTPRTGGRPEEKEVENHENHH